MINLVFKSQTPKTATYSVYGWCDSKGRLIDTGTCPADMPIEDLVEEWLIRFGRQRQLYDYKANAN